MAKVIEMFPGKNGSANRTPGYPKEVALFRALLTTKLVPAIAAFINPLLIDNPRSWPGQRAVQQKFNLSPLSLKKLRDDGFISYYCHKGVYHYDPHEIALWLKGRKSVLAAKKRKTSANWTASSEPHLSNFSLYSDAPPFSLRIQILRKTGNWQKTNKNATTLTNLNRSICITSANSGTHGPFMTDSKEWIELWKKRKRTFWKLYFRRFW